MSDPFVGEIRLVGFTFAPRGWATCDGQLLSISQNTALFSLLGTFYGGDGRATFALPNLQGATPVGTGQGPGLSPYDIGQSGGADSVTLLATEDAVHQHVMTASGNATATPDPANKVLGLGNPMYMPTGNTELAAGVIKPFGNGGPHNNRQPYLTMLYVIALQGVFPARP
jgi:microcystin-dependent protein